MRHPPAVKRRSVPDVKNGMNMADQSEDRAGRRTRSPTVVDVATEAGVAVGTVSRFLNGQSTRDANRIQIERAIDTLGYTRNAIAASMKTDISHVVGLLVPNMGEFHAELLDQLSRKFRNTGRALMTYSHTLDGRSVMEGIESFLSHRVDAIIMAGFPSLDEPLKRLVGRGLKIVLYDHDIPGLPADRVFVNNREASRHAVEHLIDLGHTRIATIVGRSEESAARERLAGYHEALAAHEIESDPHLVFYGDWRESGGYSAMASFFAQASAPTAVFSANYYMTIGALTWIHENGLRIPDDISLVSFDDFPAFRVHVPSITAIGQPAEALADNIVAALTSRLEKTGPIAHRTVTVKCGLTLRGSTRRYRPEQQGQGRENN